MSAEDRLRERIRWHCRRGMLELDLVLNRFLERHFAALGARELDALRSLLMRTDPELLDLVMARTEPLERVERDLVALMRAA